MPIFVPARDREPLDRLAGGATSLPAAVRAESDRRPAVVCAALLAVLILFAGVIWAPAGFAASSATSGSANSNAVATSSAISSSTASSSTASSYTASSSAASSASTAHSATNLEHQIVVIGASGLRWADINAETTPNLARFGQASAVGNLIVRNVRTSTCPADGWLAFSAGNRAGDAINGAGSACRYLEEPKGVGSAPSSDALVPHWDTFETAVSEQKYAAVLGSFGSVLSDSGVSTAAMGPGAAIALADSSGQVQGNYFARPDDSSGFAAQTAAALDSLSGPSRLLMIDAGQARHSRTSQAADSVFSAQVQELDSRVEAILRAIYAQDPGLSHTTVILASLADPIGSPRISMLAMAGADVTGNFISSPSTRQSGYNQATDLPATVLNWLGVDFSSQRSIFVGSTIGFESIAGTGQERIDRLIDDETHVLATRPLVGSFFAFYCVANIALFAIVSYLFSGTFLRRAARGGSWFARHSRKIIRACEIAGIAIASLPISTAIANVFPWWRSPAPALTLFALIIVIIAIIVAVALVPAWRAWRFGPIAIVSLVTSVVLAIDIATGATLQVASLMGIQPMVGGRFYGFNNQAFTLFAVSTILLAGAMANSLVQRGRRKLAFVAVAAIGIIAIALDGLPSLGADFGGPPAMFPAFALLALMALGTKLNWKKILGILVAAVVLVSTFAVVDWLRPADERTHLGRFVDTVLDGGLFDVVARKLSAGLSTVTNPLSLVALAAFLVLLIVLGRPLRLSTKNESELAPYHWVTRGVPLRQLSVDTPMFMPTIYAVYVVIAIGTLVNDSSVVILGLGLGTLVPLLIATYARWVLEINNTTPRRTIQG